MPRAIRAILALIIVALGVWLAITYTNKCHSRDVEPVFHEFFSCR
jgi:hypothetical protein